MKENKKCMSLVATMGNETDEEGKTKFDIEFVANDVPPRAIVGVLFDLLFKIADENPKTKRHLLELFEQKLISEIINERFKNKE